MKIITTKQADIFVGGWTRDADEEGLAVIDLTGKEVPVSKATVLKAKNKGAELAFAKTLKVKQAGEDLPWLSFPIKDFGTPNVAPEFWQTFADEVLALLKSGTSILIACSGGHGRTGIVGSILLGLLCADKDPVKSLRSIYCESAVETFEQHKYVHQVLGLPKPENIGYKHDYSTTTLVVPPTSTKIEKKLKPPLKDVDKLKAELDALGVYYDGDLVVCVQCGASDYEMVDVVAFDLDARTLTYEGITVQGVCKFDKLFTTDEINEMDAAINGENAAIQGYSDEYYFKSDIKALDKNGVKYNILPGNQIQVVWNGKPVVIEAAWKDGVTVADGRNGNKYIDFKYLERV